MIVLMIILSIFSACNPFDNGSTAYLTKKMDEIPIEFEGYKLIVYDPLINTVYHFEGEVEFNGSMLEIQYRYKNEDGKSCDYFVKYKDKCWYIDDEFMRQKSETYVQISHSWNDFKGYDNTCIPSRIMAIYPFDNRLFIVTDGIEDRVMRINCQGCIPITLYVFDLDDEKVYYAGYYRDYNKPDRLVGITKSDGGLSNEE